MTTAPVQRTFSFVKFYFTIVSVVSVIGMVIAYAIASYQILKHVLITDAEWVNQRWYYDVQQCAQPTYYPSRGTIAVDSNGSTKPVLAPADTGEGAMVQKTAEEITKCENDVKLRLISTRTFETKDMSIGGIVRGTFFLFLFLTHYPRMMKLERQRMATEEPTPSAPKSTVKVRVPRRASKIAKK